MATGPADVGISPQDRSAQGVLDLAGNVSEWVQDAFQERYAACDADCQDPSASAPEQVGAPMRVIRGGDWSTVAALARAATRSRTQQDRVSGSIGFRCARSESR